MSRQLDFTSKYCRTNGHSYCDAVWKGIGFQVSCICSCHKKHTIAMESLEVAGLVESPTNKRQCSNIRPVDKETTHDV